jgi:hypothetical protein
MNLIQIGVAWKSPNLSPQWSQCNDKVPGMYRIHNVKACTCVSPRSSQSWLLWGASWEMTRTKLAAINKSMQIALLLPLSSVVWSSGKLCSNCLVLCT